jgi:dTDP-4-dehydrorhamnose reductase
MKVLVIGASGQLRSDLLRVFQAADDSASLPALHAPANMITIPRRPHEHVRTLVSEERPT